MPNYGFDIVATFPWRDDFTIAEVDKSALLRVLADGATAAGYEAPALQAHHFRKLNTLGRRYPQT